MLPVLRKAPIYIYHDTGGYDGLYYAQLAASPALRNPALPKAIDNLGYRARRILLSWIAWAAARRRTGGGGSCLCLAQCGAVAYPGHVAMAVAASG